MTEIFGHWGFPPDIVAKCACGSAVVLWLGRKYARRAWQKVPDARISIYVKVLALSAALLSVGYYYYYLRGGPRIVDATYYFLQAKTFASGHLTLPLLFPSAALRGRFPLL